MHLVMRTIGAYMDKISLLRFLSIMQLTRFWGYWTTRGCHRRLCVLSFRRHLCETARLELSSPRLVQSASWRIRELSSYPFLYTVSQKMSQTFLAISQASIVHFNKIITYSWFTFTPHLIGLVFLHYRAKHQNMVIKSFNSNCYMNLCLPSTQKTHLNYHLSRDEPPFICRAINYIFKQEQATEHSVQPSAMHAINVH